MPTVRPISNGGRSSVEPPASPSRRLGRPEGCRMGGRRRHCVPLRRPPRRFRSLILTFICSARRGRRAAPYSSAPGTRTPAARVAAALSALQPRPLGIVGAVKIEASPWVEGNLWVLEVAERDTIVVGVVGNLEPGSSDFAEVLERYHKNRLFRGIPARRPLLGPRPDEGSGETQCSSRAFDCWRRRIWFWIRPTRAWICRGDREGH